MSKRGKEIEELYVSERKETDDLREQKEENIIMNIIIIK